MMLQLHLGGTRILLMHWTEPCDPWNLGWKAETWLSVMKGKSHRVLSPASFMVGKAGNMCMKVFPHLILHT